MTGSFESKDCPTSRYAYSIAHDFLDRIQKSPMSIRHKQLQHHEQRSPAKNDQANENDTQSYSTNRKTVPSANERLRYKLTRQNSSALHPWIHCEL